MAERIEQNELDLDKKVTVKNISGWTVGFSRVDTVGDVSITAEGTTRLTRNEIISQINKGNKLFTGLDGMGSHATLFIDDATTRKEVGFESEDGKTKQNILTEKSVTELFNKKSQKEFEEAFKNTIQTRAEKYAVICAMKKIGINDYSRIRFAESYTGHNMQ